MKTEKKNELTLINLSLLFMSMLPDYRYSDNLLRLLSRAL